MNIKELYDYNRAYKKYHNNSVKNYLIDYKINVVLIKMNILFDTKLF